MARVIWRSRVTGGALSDLDGTLVAGIADGDRAIVMDTTGVNFYVYEEANAGLDTPPDIVQPLDNAGNGRWVRIAFTTGLSASAAAAIQTTFDGKEDVGVAASTLAAHLLAFTHDDIAHTNRAALDAVSGTNTGDQDLSSFMRNNVANILAAGFRQTPVTVTGPTVTLDLTASNFFLYNPVQNSTLEIPTNLGAGTWILKVVGNYTLDIDVNIITMFGAYDGAAVMNLLTLVCDGTNVYLYIDTQY